jgi:hypothetical protein
MAINSPFDVRRYVYKLKAYFDVLNVSPVGIFMSSYGIGLQAALRRVPMLVSV